MAVRVTHAPSGRPHASILAYEPLTKSCCERIRTPHRAGRGHRAGLRRASARPPLRGGRVPGRRLRRGPRQAAGPAPGRVLHPPHRRGEGGGGLRPGPDRGHHRLRPPRRVRRDPRSASPRPSGSTASRTSPTSARPPAEVAASAAAGTARGPRVDDLPGHDPRGARPARSRPGGCVAGRTSSSPSRPEREDPGNPKFHTQNIPKVVGGIDPASQELATALYGAAVAQVVPVSSPEVAEAAKLLENIFRAVNIALANEMKVVLDRMGIDVWEVIEAAKTKPFGFMPFYPGPGLGGHCIPLDPFYLTWKAAEHGVLGPLHRARRGDQHRDAGVRGGPHRQGAQPPREEPQGRRGSWSWASPTRRTSTTTGSRPPSRSSSGCRRRGPKSRTATPTSRWPAPGVSTTSASRRSRAPPRNSPATTCWWCRRRTRTSVTRRYSRRRSWWSTRGT